MAQAARDYLLVPSADVGVERLFSGARDVLSQETLHECRDDLSSYLVLLGLQGA